MSESTIEAKFKTPMMQQYLNLKKDYPDCLLFFRMGDFYELFMEDAEKGAQVMDIALTSRSKGSEEKIPMCGVPFHAIDSYLGKIVKAGYKAAICEQTSKPKPGAELVERKVVRIITPGTIVDENLLSTKANNFLITFLIFQNKICFCYTDASTGEFYIKEIFHDGSEKNLYQNLINEIKRINPSEIILSNDLYHNYELLNNVQNNADANIYPFRVDLKKTHIELQYLIEFFKVKTLDVFGINEDNPEMIKTIYVLVNYLQHNFKSGIKHINKIINANENEHMRLDSDTIHNLEIFHTNRIGSGRAKSLSLFETINKTSTPMGERTLRNWIIYPLIDLNEIKIRQDATESLIENKKLIDILDEKLKKIGDIERILSRLGTQRSNPRDLINLANSINASSEILEIVNTLPKITNQLKITSEVKAKAKESSGKINEAIKENPPLSIREGNIIKDDYNVELDELKSSIKDSKEWIIQLEGIEKQKTGIHNLKVGFNSVFGYYIEITKSNTNLAPAHYIRKQTLVNAERYITQELKEKEEIVLRAEEKINELEADIYQSLVNDIIQYIPEIQIMAKAVGIIDCFLSFSKAAIFNNYVKPSILPKDKNVFKITEGRHPIVEKSLNAGEFTPNNTSIDKNSHIHIITGPNMAGKSTYIRQIALIQLLAQTGSYVPAYEAEISIADGIYTRIGAGDALAQGLSTFMVEMIETAKILNNATEYSLIILDEVGRGTGTLDGLGIAKSIVEYIHNKIKAKTLFATHFHELTELERELKHLKNFHVKIIEKNAEIKFLHRIEEGGTDKSYGIEVAKIAGLPIEVIDKAKHYLNKNSKKQLSLF